MPKFNQEVSESTKQVTTKQKKLNKTQKSSSSLCSDQCGSCVKALTSKDAPCMSLWRQQLLTKVHYLMPWDEKVLWFLTESAIAYRDKWARPLFESKKVFSRLCGGLAVKLHVEYGRWKEMLRINMVIFLLTKCYQLSCKSASEKNKLP